MSVKLLTQHNLEFPSLLGGCTGSSESTLVKMPHCWKSHVAAQFILQVFFSNIICSVYTVVRNEPNKHVWKLYTLHRLF